MAKLPVLVLLVAVVAATTAVVSTAGATIPGFQTRRSRFLAASRAGAVDKPPLPSYACSKKSAAICLTPASPGLTCCGGQCVDTLASADHCGGCHKVCTHGRVCCGGRCVHLLSDKDNCGSCFNQCDKKCSYGFCDYAQ